MKSYFNTLDKYLCVKSKTPLCIKLKLKLISNLSVSVNDVLLSRRGMMHIVNIEEKKTSQEKRLEPFEKKKKNILYIKTHYVITM